MTVITGMVTVTETNNACLDNYNYNRRHDDVDEDDNDVVTILSIIL